MNCENFTERLDDYLDGEMLPAGERALEAHAAGCAACGRTLAVARNLQRQALALPAEREPSRDLWPGIAGRLEPRNRMGMRRERNWPRALAAGVAVVAVFAGGMLANRVMQDMDSGSTATPRQVERLPSVADARRILPASHVELIEGESAGGIATGTEQALLRNLLIVNLAIRETETAIAENPANSRLRELLSGLYAQENRILTEAERLRSTRQSTTRTTI